MSKHASDDLAGDAERLGYFLPEDGQHRLKKLRGHMEFLSHLAQPRPAGAGADGLPEIQGGELAVCLELLAEQAAQVLDAVSWPAHRDEACDSTACDEDADVAQDVSDEAQARFVFGVTLDQIDALDRLVQTLSACADVMVASADAELPERTVPQLGQAACDAAIAMRALLDQVEAQRLGHPAGGRNRVRETRVEYAVRRSLPAPYGRLAEVAPSRIHRPTAPVRPLSQDCLH